MFTLKIWKKNHFLFHSIIFCASSNCVQNFAIENMGKALKETFLSMMKELQNAPHPFVMTDSCVVVSLAYLEQASIDQTISQ